MVASSLSSRPARDRSSVENESSPPRNRFSTRADLWRRKIQRPRNRRRLVCARPATRRATKRAARLHRPRPGEPVPWRNGDVSLLKRVGKGQKDQLRGIEDSVHRHRNKDRSAPLVGKSETNPEDEQRQGRWQMGMRGGKEQRVRDNPDGNAQIATEHTINEKPKNEFLRDRCDHYRQNNYGDPLLDRLRAVEQIDNLLLARAAAKNGLSNTLGQANQRRCREQ